MSGLPRNFPFKDIFKKFLKEYTQCTTYWYVPKTRTLSDENVKAIQGILSVIFEDFLNEVWNPKTQDRILQALVKREILEPYRPEGVLSDRTALTRIWKKLLETLGLLWVHDEKEIIITDVGLDVIIQEDPRAIIESQIAKIQYPNPSLTGTYRRDFKGILPHLFLLQILQKCGYKITVEEYELFVNLGQEQQDLQRVVSYIQVWRDLNNDEKKTLRDLVKDIPLWEDARQPQLFSEEETENTRHNRIHLNSSYQRALYTFPSYLAIETNNEGSFIICNAPKQVDTLVSEKLQGLKITLFNSLEDWFSYFGDPSQRPSWFTYLALEVEKATNAEEASKLVEEHKTQLTNEEQKEIVKKQIEKKIEDFYVDCLEMIEKGLNLVENGRQYSTPIGRIDLLCRSNKGEYVIIEIKADEAGDSAFGQILRYIGWVHRNIADSKKNVRGILLAAKFPESARYSRIGLLKEDYETFLKFKQHGLNVSDT